MNNALDAKEIRREVMKEKSERKSSKFGGVKNCGFESDCKLRLILWILYTVAIAENGLLVFIFFRHREMRSDRNIIILNLAVADILSVLSNASLQIIFIYGGPFQRAKVYYRIADLSLEVSTGVCIYSIVVLSIQRYFAVFPSYKCRECGFARRFNSTLFVLGLWAVGCVPQIIHVTTNMSFRAWAMRNLILYCVIPIVAIATFYLMTSWRLRQSVRKMPGEAMRQETARHARVRSSNVLIALIVVFVISYTPIQLFRFIELWYFGGGYLFDYVDLIAYSLLSLNSCFNPVALYVASGTFRRYYNRYICYRRKDAPVNMSSSNLNIHNTNKTCALHI
jgi:gastrin-releasing peptide receptor/ATP-dependent RNA helicase UAP56/SUB2